MTNDKRSEVARLIRDLWFQTAHGQHTRSHCRNQAHKGAVGARVGTDCINCTVAEIGALTGKHATAKAYLRHVLAIRKLETELGVE